MAVKHMTLLTGATGFVGRELVRELTAAGHWLLLLIRGATFEEARSKYKELLKTLSPMEGARCVFVWGDVTHPGLICGDQCYINQSRTLIKTFVGRVLHCAASISFDGDAEVFQTNQLGTVRVLELMSMLEIPEMHYISTAYVNGQNPGSHILESMRLHDRQINFRNNYEESKCVAERSVRAWASIEEYRSCTVYRPAIIVGDSMTGRTTCYQGFYALVRCAQFVRRALKDGRLNDAQALRIPLNGDEPVNLVPIDYVVDFVATAFGDKRHYDMVYHIVPKVPFTVRQVVDAISHYFKFDGIELVGRRDDLAINGLEQMLSDYLGPYFRYFGTDSYFLTDNADRVMSWQPDCAQSQLLLWIDYAVKSNFGRKK